MLDFQKSKNCPSFVHLRSYQGAIQTKISIQILSYFCPVIFLSFSFETGSKIVQKLDNIGHIWTSTGQDQDRQGQK